MSNKASIYRPLGKSGLDVPPVIFGTSCLGNLYQIVPEHTKAKLISEIFDCCTKPVVLDSAGKYGAGLALEIIGKSLRNLSIPRSQVLISNKLGWYRVPLKDNEPTFERNVWKGISNDAELRISYEGILQCFEQGCELLGKGYISQLVSVHDPDEYLALASTPHERKKHLNDIIDAYIALFELKAKGIVQAIGIGSKDWRVIREITDKVDLDWVMFACSLTVYSHPKELIDFIAHLDTRKVGMINSAVFNSGFLTGGKWFDYRQPDPVNDLDLFIWRDKFFRTCNNFNVEPADACVQFGLALPGIIAVALNTEKPERIKKNLKSISSEIPLAFWSELKEKGLINKNFPIHN
jgi:D-threo-aldose 1-dehydrogenase